MESFFLGDWDLESIFINDREYFSVFGDSKLLIGLNITDVV